MAGQARRGVTVRVLTNSLVANDVPLVHAGALHLSAQLLTVVPGQTGCLRCLFEAPPPGPPA